MTAQSDHKSAGEAAAPRREGVAGAVSDLAEGVSALVRAEVDLAKAEFAAGVKAKATGIGLVVAAAVLGWLGLQGLLLAAGFALALVVPGWAAALIVTGALFLLAAILGAVAAPQLRKPVGIDGAKEQASKDVAWVKQRLRAPRTSEQIQEDVAWTRQQVAK